MNVAIIIAVSQYLDKDIDDLQGCAADGRVIENIIRHSGRFDEILPLMDDTSSKTLKRELTKFISQLKDEEIEEVFLYYTGHGDLRGEEFRYLLSDFNDARTNQTSLSNEEIDTLLRSLNPTLAVKVVDACHAGVTYIKDHNALMKSVEATRGRFEKCYFMFSSQRDQSSFQDSGLLSDFTSAFARAIKAHEDSSIRYQDIADFIADDFSDNPDQTPRFVFQADLIEEFCNISPKMIQSIETALVSPAPAGSAIVTTEPVKTPSLINLVKQDAERYCSEQEANQSLALIAEVSKSYPFPTELMELFNVEIKKHSDFHSLPERRSIGEWLESNHNDYFVELDYEEITYEANEYVPVSPKASIMPAITLGMPQSYEYKTIKRKRSVVSGYSFTRPVIVAVSVGLEPRYPNLELWKLHICYIYSKVSLRFFYSIVWLTNTSWNERKLASELKWKTQEVPLKDERAIEAAVGEMLVEFQQAVIDDLQNEFQHGSELTGEESELPESEHLDSDTDGEVSAVEDESSS